MSLIPSNTSFPFLGALIYRSNIFEWRWDKTDTRYSGESHLYCSSQPSVFPNVVLNVDIIFLCLKKKSIKQLLCAVVVAASCLLSSDKNE